MLRMLPALLLTIVRSLCVAALPERLTANELMQLQPNYEIYYREAEGNFMTWSLRDQEATEAQPGLGRLADPLICFTCLVKTVTLGSNIFYGSIRIEGSPEKPNIEF